VEEDMLQDTSEDAEEELFGIEDKLRRLQLKKLLLRRKSIATEVTSKDAEYSGEDHPLEESKEELPEESSREDLSRLPLEEESSEEVVLEELSKREFQR
jgi:hypothetical protein